MKTDIWKYRLTAMAMVALGTVALAAQPIRVAAEAKIPLPPAAEWSLWPDFAPTDTESVTLNPPMFSWLYVPSRADRASDLTEHQFVLQCAYDPSFSTPVVNVRSKCNFYNLLAPFQNSPVYWRVGYINPQAGTNVATWSATRSFTVPPGTPQWDRSFLADGSYLAAKGHPRIMFDSNTLVRLRANLSDTNVWLTAIRATNAAWAIMEKTWELNNADFTVEFWIHFDALPPAAVGLIGQRADNNNQWVMSLTADHRLDMTFSVGGAVRAAYQMNSVWALDTNWHHLAFVRQGGAGKIFIDGVTQAVTGSVPFGANAVGPLNAPLMMGTVSGLPAFTGWLDELRVSKGIARYTQNFTPAGAEFSSSSLNVCLVHFNGAQGATTCPETSATGGPKYVLLSGTAQIVTNIARLGNAAVFLGSAGTVQVQDWWMDPQPVGLDSQGVWQPANIHLDDLLDLGLSWRLTGLDIYLLGGRTQKAVSLLADDMINVGYLVHDNFLGNTVDGVATAYDLLYEALSADQRASVVKAVDLFAAYNLRGFGFWFTSKVTGTNALISYGSPKVLSDSAAKQGNGHPWANALYTLQAVIATITESTNQDTRDFFDIAVNYMVARTYPYGGAWEGGYNVGVRYSALGVNRVVLLTALLQCAFPEMHFERNPFWLSLADWHMRTIPVGMVEANSPWGDTGWGEARDWEGGGLKSIYLLSQSGAALQHSRNQRALKNRSPATDPLLDFTLFSVVTNSPVPVDIASNAAVYPRAGWVFGSSLPVNTHAAWTNGCGFIFCARPRGSDYQHDHNLDLSFQFWAYGSTITDGGGDMYPYPKVPIAHNTLLVNGLGTAQPDIQRVPAYARIIAFAQGENYVYTAADGTQAYPTAKFQTASGWLRPQLYSTLHSGGPLTNLLSVVRHVLFVRGKYWIIYDSLAHRTPARFTWLYHLYENTLADLDAAGNFTYLSNTRRLTGYDTNAPSVRVLVRHLGGGTTVTNMTGIKVRSNPFTGEDYYALGDMNRIRAHAIWVSNENLATNFHFMSVVFPVKPGTADPQIRSLDEFTVEVTNGPEHDVISFDPLTTRPATLVVNAPLIEASTPPVPPSQTQRLRVTGK